MRTKKKIYSEMERLAAGEYAKYNVDTIGTLAWVLGFAESIPKGVKMAHEAITRSNVEASEDK